MTNQFDPAAEVARLSQMQAINRRKRYCKSRLDKFRHQLLALHKAGASLSQLQLWLRHNRLKVSRSTISRWLHGKVQQP